MTSPRKITQSQKKTKKESLRPSSKTHFTATRRVLNHKQKKQCGAPSGRNEPKKEAGGAPAIEIKRNGNRGGLKVQEGRKSIRRPKTGASVDKSNADVRKTQERIQQRKGIAKQNKIVSAMFAYRGRKSSNKKKRS